MKKVRPKTLMKLTAALALASIAASDATWAQSRGGVDSGGGDLQVIRERRIRTLVSQLKDDLLYYVDSVAPENLSDEESRKIYESLLAQGLREDIRKSSYALKPRCVDRDGVERFATAVVGKRGGEICLNLPMLVKGEVTEREIYTLIIHEHAHQLGIRDENAAYQAGEALSASIAGKLFYSPRKGKTPVMVPVVNKEGCLNLRNVTERIYALPKDTPAWHGLYDVIFPIEASNWYRAFAMQTFGGTLPYDDTVSGVFNTQPFYQNGCQSLLVPTDKDRFEEVKIRSYSSTHIEADGTTEDGLGATITFTMPEGKSGNRLFAKVRRPLEGVLRCTGCDGGMENESTSENHVITFVYQFVFGTHSPERMTVTSRAVRELSRAAHTYLDLMGNRPGCMPSGE